MKAATGGRLFERREPLRRPEGYNALVGRAIRQPIQLFARLKAHGNTPLPAHRDDFLQARAPCALRNYDAIQRAAGAQGLPHGMDSY